MSIFDVFKRNQTKQTPPVSSGSIPAKSFAQIRSESVKASALSEHIKNAVPSAGGLYPHEILMLNYADSYNHLKNDFARFWQTDYYVDDPQRLLTSLFNRGFLCLSDIKVSLEKRPMAELKELLERINEKIPRKKEDAIARILEIYDLQQLDVMFPARYYQLTETGKAEVEQNEYVLYLHRHRLMTVWEMNSLLSKTNTDPKRYRDIIWGELQRQSIEHMQKGDFGLYRNDKLAMHDILVEEKKYREALLLLCEVISYDLSGLSNGELSLRSYEDLVVRQVRFNSKMASLIFNPSSGEVTLPPGIIRYYESLFKSLEMTADEFIRTSYQLFNRIQIHERVFTAEECANIALSEIGLEERKLKNSYQIAQQRIKGVTVKYYASIMKEPSPPKV